MLRKKAAKATLVVAKQKHFFQQQKMREELPSEQRLKDKL